MQDQQHIFGRRSLIPGAPYYVPISVPFTATLNELISVYSQPTQAVGDLDLIGAVSDIDAAKVQFSINARPVWSSEKVPVPTLFGRPDSVKPVLWFQRPLRLLHGARIRADLTNAGGEAAGTMVFICRQLNVPLALQQPLGNLQDIGELEIIPLDSQFTGTVNEVKITSTSVLDHDFLLRALHTTLGQATIRMFGLGGQLWMEQPVPIWALAGRATSAIPNQPMQPPCLIPKGYNIQVEFTNAGPELSGHIYLVGQRLQ
jgi:hypothetical protein